MPQNTLQPAMLPLLSISIPTFNRARYLEQLLESIGQQCGVDWSRIEILISDNASEDDTGSVVEYWTKKLPVPVRYVRNEVNTHERNIAAAFWRASGDYIWVIGDDDLLFPNAVAAVQHAIAWREPALLFLRGVGFNRRNQIDLGTANPAKVEIVNLSKRLLCEQVHVHLSFITAIVTDARRIRLRSSPERTDELFGTHLIQYAWVLEALREGPLLYLVPPLIAGRTDNDIGGFGKLQVFVENHAALVERFLGDDPEIVRRINMRSLTNYLVDFLDRPPDGSKLVAEEWSKKRALLHRRYGHTWQYFWFIAPLLNRLSNGSGKIWLRIIAFVASSLRRKYNRLIERRLKRELKAQTDRIHLEL